MVHGRRTDALPLVHVFHPPRIGFRESLYALTPRKCIVVRPRVLVGGTTQSPDLIKLVEVRLSGQNWFAGKHLSKDTSILHVSKHRGEAFKIAHPMPHISISAPYCLAPKSNSGGRYHLVTTQFVYLRLWEPASVATVGSNVRARPKSAIFNEPSLEISRLAAFISRCKMWFLNRMSA